MSFEIKLFLIYIISVSVVSVVVCVADKCFAILNRRRVSERCLIILCLLGGSVAMYATMRIIRHKTLHNKFMVGIPLIFILQAVLFLLFYLKLG